MATSEAANSGVDPEALKSEWLDRLNRLIADVNQWCAELDWSTRQIEKRMKDTEIGEYKAPALLMQHETVKILLEPITRKGVGADGVLDLYLLPAYDDLASLYYSNGEWQLHYMFPSSPTVANIQDAESKPFTKSTFAKVLEAMKENA